MGLRSRLTKWLVKDEAVKSTVFDNLQEHFQGFLKAEIVAALKDEELAGAITQYGDSLYNRYQAKFTGWLGGTGKGVNSVLNSVGKGNGNQNNLLNKVVGGFGSEGFSFANILKEVLMSGLSGNSQTSLTSSNGSVGVMS